MREVVQFIHPIKPAHSSHPSPGVRQRDMMSALVDSRLGEPEVEFPFSTLSAYSSSDFTPFTILCQAFFIALPASSNPWAVAPIINLVRLPLGKSITLLCKLKHQYM